MNTVIQLFKSILEISLFASSMIIIVLLIRAVAKDRINVKVISFFWFLVILRLCLPGMLESPVHLGRLFPETAVSQETAEQPVLQDAGINAQSNISGSRLSEHEPVSPIKGTTSDSSVVIEPQAVSFYDQVINFIKSIDLWLAAAVLWITGGAVVLALTLKECIAFSLRLRKNSYILTDRRILDIVEAHKKANHLRRAVKVSVCSSVHMPMAVGTLRPQILLPLYLTEDLTEKHINAILLHEVCHIKRNDILINYACILAKALHWFNPLIWICAGIIKEDMEFACDQKVLKLMKTGQEIRYCESLLYAARFIRQRKIPQYAASLYESKSNLKERIIKMVKPRKKSKPAAAVSLVLAFAMFIACFTTACQPTPEKPAVVGRQEDILSDVTSVPSSDFKPIEAPEHISEVHDDYPYLKISYDADVVVPETTAYPVTEMKKRVLTEEEVLSFIDLFTDGDYEMYAGWTLTKDDYLALLTKAKQYEGTERVTKDEIERLRELYNKATNDIVNPRIESFSELPEEMKSSVDVRNKNGVISSFGFGGGFAGNHFGYTRDISVNALSSEMTDDSQYVKNMDGPYEHFAWKKPGEPDISQEDAYAVALQCKESLGTDLELYSAEPCSFIKDYVDKTTGWQFMFTRAISGLQTIDTIGSLGWRKETAPSYGSPWGREQLIVSVDKNGLFGFWWSGASAISRTAVSSAQLLDFESIHQRITGQLSFNYAYVAEESGKYEIEISEIKLGISMISMESRTDIGEYLPTWYVTYRYRLMSQGDKDWNVQNIMFSAIDGSYIEPRISVSDLMGNMDVGSSDLSSRSNG